MTKITTLLQYPIAALLVAIVATGSTNASEYNLEEIRQATIKYKDVEAALEDGYIPDPSGHCATAEEAGLPSNMGSMGIHYLHPGRLKITSNSPLVDGDSTHTDFMRPSILLYEPQADGSMELVGVENLVWVKAWQETGNTGDPMFNGQPYDKMVDDPNTDVDEAHGFADHYDLHLWVHRDNPNGATAVFNPMVSCSNAQQASH